MPCSIHQLPQPCKHVLFPSIFILHSLCRGGYIRTLSWVFGTAVFTWRLCCYIQPNIFLHPAVMGSHDTFANESLHSSLPTAPNNSKSSLRLYKHNLLILTYVLHTTYCVTHHLPCLCSKRQVHQWHLPSTHPKTWNIRSQLTSNTW